MARTFSTHAVAQALGVSEQTIRYHARKGTFAYDVTPGGHRRFDLDEVRGALPLMPAAAGGSEFPSRGSRIDLSTPAGRLTESMAFQLAGTAVVDEGDLDRDDERLDLPDFMDGFAVPGSARYPQESHAVGAGA